MRDGIYFVASDVRGLITYSRDITKRNPGKQEAEQSRSWIKLRPFSAYMGPLSLWAIPAFLPSSLRFRARVNNDSSSAGGPSPQPSLAGRGSQLGATKRRVSEARAGIILDSSSNWPRAPSVGSLTTPQ
jgi:hypothetical protein